MKALFTFLIFTCLLTRQGVSQTERDTSFQESEYTYEKKNSFTSIFYGQPGDAAAWSLLLPGGGQLYNKRWWKAPLIWAGEGYLIYNLANKNSALASWDDCWRGLLNDGGHVCSGAANNTTTSANAFTRRQSAKSARELAWIFFVAGHLIQTLEAFVDRHLINFDTSPELGYQQFEQANRIIRQNEITSQVPIFQVSIALYP